MIQMEEVSYSYGKQSFIKNMDITFPSGEITTIIGPNGSGKSTVLKILSRLVKPQTGRVLIDHKNISSFPHKELARQISFLQQYNHIPDMTAEQAVLYARYPYLSPFGGFSVQDKEKAEYAMEMTGCSLIKNKTMAKLSGGERQRVYLAMILAQETPFVLLDEPTTYLDIQVAYETMDWIQKVKATFHKTVIMVLHDMDLAFNYSDHLIIMEKGEIHAMGNILDPKLKECVKSTFQIEIMQHKEGNQASYYHVKS